MLLFRSFLIAVLSLLLSSQKATEVSHSYTYDNGLVDILNGHVKQIIALHQSIIGEGFFDTVTTVFDKKGHQGEVLTAAITGKKSKDDFINSYDKNGKIIETKIAGSTVKGVYKYGKNGYSIKVRYTPDDPESSEMLYIYNADGYLTEVNYYGKPGVLVDVINYKYDQSHRVTKTEQRSAKGELKLTQTFQYLAYSVDSKNNWIKEKVITKDIYPSFVNTKTHVLSRKIFYY